jgi:hypothetical protein
MLPDWSARLAAVIDAASKKTFAYGTFDCALFAAECVQATTGIDYAVDLRGYQSKLQAYRIVKEYGSLEAMITALLKCDPFHPCYAQPGDVVLGSPELQSDEEGEAIGICVGVKFAFPKQIGISMYSMDRCRLAWRPE